MTVRSTKGQGPDLMKAIDHMNESTELEEYQEFVGGLGTKEEIVDLLADVLFALAKACNALEVSLDDVMTASLERHHNIRLDVQ